MAEHRRHELAGVGVVHTVFTDTSDGDLAVGQAPGELASRRARLAPGEWTWLHQVHGAKVVVVDTPGTAAGEQADAAVSATPAAVLSVQVADCAPVLLWAPLDDGAVVAAVHAGWRGVAAGVLGSAVGAMVDLGAEAATVRAEVGPCIAAADYEFDGPELDELSERLGPHVVAESRRGTPALDLRAAVRSALADAGVHEPIVATESTARSGRHWSHRARRDPQRQAGVIWWEATR